MTMFTKFLETLLHMWKTQTQKICRLTRLLSKRPLLNVLSFDAGGSAESAQDIKTEDAATVAVAGHCWMFENATTTGSEQRRKEQQRRHEEPVGGVQLVEDLGG